MKRVRNKKEGKFSIPAFIIPVLDYVYYRIWLWCQKHVKNESARIDLAVGFLCLMIVIPILYTMAFFMEMSDIPRYKMLTYLLLATLPLYIRYDYSNKYKNSNYQIFRDRWENEPIEKHKRNGKIILAAFIIIVIIIPITLIFLSIIGIIPELPIW